MTEEDLLPGTQLTIRQATNTISRATFEIEVEIVWVESGNVHYRKSGRSAIEQTPVDRFLEIVNNPPRERH
ncbi:hypothetical protein [Sphingomonas sp. 3-13AW]|uniref:hypothetical protein n=1 Tax=Sphingomonas sp. 3-13AW TaxID=3050450 RepID=UPI003BB7255C